MVPCQIVFIMKNFLSSVYRQQVLSTVFHFDDYCYIPFHISVDTAWKISVVTFYWYLRHLSPYVIINWFFVQQQTNNQSRHEWFQGVISWCVRAILTFNFLPLALQYFRFIHKCCAFILASCYLYYFTLALKNCILVLGLMPHIGLE